MRTILLAGVLFLFAVPSVEARHCRSEKCGIARRPARVLTVRPLRRIFHRGHCQSGKCQQ